MTNTHTPLRSGDPISVMYCGHVYLATVEKIRRPQAHRRQRAVVRFTTAAGRVVVRAVCIGQRGPACRTCYDLPADAAGPATCPACGRTWGPTKVSA